MGNDNQRGEIFPIPKGDVTAYTPDGSIRAEDNGLTCSNAQESFYLHGGPHATTMGGPFGYNSEGCADVIGTQRKKPDYGGI